MKKIAVIYHSAQGNTEEFARRVTSGARSAPNVEVSLIKAAEIAATPDRLLEFDGFLWGSPTYLGGVSAPFKAFMDATGRLWKTQQLKGRLAGGFTVSGLPAGDKQSTLISLFTFSMQHGMIWVGNPFLPEQHSGVPYEQAINRLGSWTGLMTQAGHTSGESAHAPGDLRSAEAFGRNFALVLGRLDAQAAFPPAEELA